MILAPELRAVFQAARALLTRGWTQKVMARNAEGAAVHPYDPGATCWCAEGALFAATASLHPPDDVAKVFYRVHAAMIEAIRPWNQNRRPLSVINDDSESVDPILALFDVVLSLKS